MNLRSVKIHGRRYRKQNIHHLIVKFIVFAGVKFTVLFLRENSENSENNNATKITLYTV